jgi:nuclear transport factor 2 (NTF2) superfamily protein
LNKEKGPIFDININENQYIINESQNKNNEIKNKEKINKEKEEKENKNDNLEEDKKSEEENNKDKLNEEKDNEKETIEKHNNFNQINNTQIQIKADDNENSNLVNEINNNDNNNINGEEEDNIINKCRICFETYSSEDNPKICLCSCKDCIHLACLKYYIKTKIEFHENEKGTVKTYICNKFNCEVCLMPYPLRFRIPKYNRIYELVDLRMPSELNYVVIESLDYIKEHNNIKTIYLVQLTDDEYHIGRYDSNDIIDTDISVSRNHATLKFNREKGKIYLENKSEKFGTLVLIKDNLKIKENNINFQVGRTYINAKLESYRVGDV